MAETPLSTEPAADQAPACPPLDQAPPEITAPEQTVQQLRGRVEKAMKLAQQERKSNDELGAVLEVYREEAGGRVCSAEYKVVQAKYHVNANSEEKLEVPQDDPNIKMAEFPKLLRQRYVAFLNALQERAQHLKAMEQEFGDCNHPTRRLLRAEYSIITILRSLIATAREMDMDIEDILMGVNDPQARMQHVELELERAAKQHQAALAEFEALKSSIEKAIGAPVLHDYLSNLDNTSYVDKQAAYFKLIKNCKEQVEATAEAEARAKQEVGNVGLALSEFSKVAERYEGNMDALVRLFTAIEEKLSASITVYRQRK